MDFCGVFRIGADEYRFSLQFSAGGGGGGNGTCVEFWREICSRTSTCTTVVVFCTQSKLTLGLSDAFILADCVLRR